MSSASGTEKQGFRVVHESAPFRGKQGHIYRPAVSAESVDSKALHMQLLEIPPAIAWFSSRSPQKQPDTPDST